jgi:hypothetical protein
MNATARFWFATFAIVGMTSGLLAAGLLWSILTRPLVVVQALVGLP